jgi:carboxy-terminal domain RNA polymerase II polypeptide A small phosphatase
LAYFLVPQNKHLLLLRIQYEVPKIDKAFFRAINSIPMIRKLLILDLDETLLFATESALDRVEDFQVGPYYVYLRPGLSAFLSVCFQCYDVAVWTSSSSTYAAGVVPKVFEDRDLKFIWSSERCTSRRDFENDTYVNTKNLAKVKRRGYDLAQVVTVDDTPMKYSRNFGNLVRVTEYLGGVDDDELFKLGQYLKELALVPNVRVVEKRYWREQFAKWAVDEAYSGKISDV